MEQYVALDVSLKEISVCIIDSNGAVVFEGKTATEPATLVALIRRKAPRVVRVGLETGSTSLWLFQCVDLCRTAGRVHGCTTCPRRFVDAAHELGPQRCPRFSRHATDGLVSCGACQECCFT